MYHILSYYTTYLIVQHLNTRHAVHGGVLNKIFFLQFIDIPIYNHNTDLRWVQV